MCAETGASLITHQPIRVISCLSQQPARLWLIHLTQSHNDYPAHDRVGVIEG